MDFLGKTDDEPSMAENWLERIERSMRKMHCTLKENLKCATSLLQDEAYQWWVSVTRTAPPESVTWETKEEKCCKFEDGLNDHIGAHVTGFFHDDFSKIVTCALNVKRVKKEKHERKERRQGKKNLGQSRAYQHKSKKFRGPQGSNQPTAQGSAQATGSKTILPAPSVAFALGGSSRGPTPPYCTHCGRKHKGECWRLTCACLVCGSNEHKVKDCLITHLFTAPRTGGIVLAVQKSNKDNKSVVSSSASRQATQTMGKLDARAPARAYATKAGSGRERCTGCDSW